MSSARVRLDQKAATRAALLAAARKLFVERGYASTSTEDLVAESKTGTRGALYHHFTDKRALFEAAFEEVIAEFAESAFDKVPPSDDPLEQIDKGLRTFLDAASADPELQRIILIDGPSVLGWDTWRTKQEHLGVALITEMLRTAVATGVIDEQPVEPLAYMLVAMINDAALYIAYSHDPVKARHEVADVVQNLVLGLRRHPS